MRKAVLSSLAMFVLASCSLAPTFQAPDMQVPSAFKEADIATDASWQPARVLEGEERGPWWLVFDDPLLNVLEENAATANPDLAAAAARVEQARAAARAAKADLLPNLDLNGNAVRSKPSGEGRSGFSSVPYTLYNATGTLSYEPDLFGRVRDTQKAFFHDAKAEQALYHSLLLTLQADVAQTYFAIRAIDSERGLLKETVAIRQKAADIMKKRLDAGYASEGDFANAQADLESIRAELTALERQRAVLEHALAILQGRLPSDFALSDMPLVKDSPPQIPAGLPSALLQRRPDIAGALETMKAANARIGAAKAAFFPDLTLTASGGAESTALGNLFQWSARTWALGQVGGALLSLPVFDNGRRSAALDRARASYDEALARYRSQVLDAFRDVEDSLSGQRLLAQQARQQEAAATAARRATALVGKRYDAGDADYLDVVTAQRFSLAADRAAVQLRGQRFIATVALIRALGGGWEETGPK